MKTVAIIQARMSSTRLPGKVLKIVEGRTILDRMVERVRRAKTVDETIVATTVDPSDDAIVEVCEKIKVPVFRGNLQDVLDRYYQAARQYQADVVIRLTGDCPLIDPDLIDEVVRKLQTEKVDFVCNRLPPPMTRTYPIGLDVEACTFQALERAWKEATEKHEREHVLPYLYEVPGRFKVIQLDYVEDLGKLRWTLDTPEDLQLLQAIYHHFDGRNDFSWLDVLALNKGQPEMFEVNSTVKHKSFLDYEKRNSGK
jgi:spore coat polysaccharide biosynthesis protein SpsF